MDTMQQIASFMQELRRQGNAANGTLSYRYDLLTNKRAVRGLVSVQLLLQKARRRA
jgi:hypothetical protein